DLPPTLLPIPPAHTLLAAWCAHMAEDYAATMERPGSEGRRRWEGCVSFAFFRLAVITQGIAARHARGNASSARAAEYATIFPLMGRLATEHIEQFAEGGRAKL
ncbi:hypothetical protein JCM6882_007769, partial [Rhodosporidiobolus microsporus]